uniref:Uncharacterized protein n=1 Tax=Strigamia maritima TaxID=126957 RepID=T1J628_STRMM
LFAQNSRDKAEKSQVRNPALPVRFLGEELHSDGESGPGSQIAYRRWEEKEEKELMECVRFGLMSDRDILDISNSSQSAAGNAEECLKFAPKPCFCLREPSHSHLRAGDDDGTSKSTSTVNCPIEELEYPETERKANESGSYRESPLKESHHFKELLAELTL